MATYKRIDGDYAITTLNSADNVTITTHTLEVVGNLDVSGNLTYINVTELNIQDPFILLNASNTGTYAHCRQHICRYQIQCHGHTVGNFQQH